MKTNLRYFGWVLLLYVFIFWGCKDDDAAPEPDDNHNFVSATLTGNFSKSLIQTYASAFGYSSYAAYIKNDVSFYKLVYKTTFKGKEIEASGLVAIPRGVTTAPALLSAQHGTMFREADAPSNFPNAFSGFELFGATGFITVIPDYVGMGASKDIVHPFYDQQYAASAVIDMLKATKYYLQRENIAFNNNLFLLGYSEGGFVTMAAQKEIETNASHNLKLTAVAAGAGAYDLRLMMNMVIAAPTYSNPAFLAKLLHAYNSTYNWNRPMADFFREPYAAAIPNLLNGTKNLEEVNNGLTDRPEALFNPTFFQNLQNTAGEATLKQRLLENSFMNWTPKSPTRLYHGTRDEAVYFQTSETTYNRFRQSGATNVEFIPVQDGTHASTIEPMVFNALQWFESLNK